MHDIIIFEDLRFRVCLHVGGRPQVGEVTRGGSPHLSCKRDQIKMRDYVDRRVTSPSWGPPPPCKQALSPSTRKRKAGVFKNFNSGVHFWKDVFTMTVFTRYMWTVVRALNFMYMFFFKLMFGLIVNFAFLFEKVFFNTCYLAITLDRVL